jgi:hypothetical protein
MAGVLTLGQWIGGPDDVKVESTFPSSQRTYTYNFDQNITGWTFKLDYQAIVVDQIAYTRDGEPNFADSRVVGFFPAGVETDPNMLRIISTGAGQINVTHKANLYPDANGILPDSRVNVPILVMSFGWTNNQLTPPVTNMHRVAKILAWEPGVVPKDPTTLSGTGYTSILPTN